MNISAMGCEQAASRLVSTICVVAIATSTVGGCYGLSPLKNYRSDTRNTKFNAVGEHPPAVERSNLGQRLSVDGRHTKG